jgi:hypothetical protein
MRCGNPELRADFFFGFGDAQAVGGKPVWNYDAFFVRSLIGPEPGPAVGDDAVGKLEYELAEEQWFIGCGINDFVVDERNMEQNFGGYGIESRHVPPGVDHIRAEGFGDPVKPKENARVFFDPPAFDHMDRNIQPVNFLIVNDVGCQHKLHLKSSGVRQVPQEFHNSSFFSAGAEIFRKK